MRHLDEGTIHAWLDGALTTEEAARADAHAQTCAECAAMVAEARGLIAGASRIAASLDVGRGGVVLATPSDRRPSERSVWHRLRMTPARSAIAATVLVGVATMFAVRGQRTRDVAPAVPAPSVADSAPVTEPPRVPAAPARASAKVERQGKAEASAPAIAEKAEQVAAAPSAPLEPSATTGSSNALRSAGLAPDSGAKAPKRMTAAMSGRASGVAAPAPATSMNSADARESTSIRCYRVAFDSAWARTFPERLALSRNERGQPLVAATRGEGITADSVLFGVDWSMSEATTVIRFAAPESATLSFAADGSGLLQSAGRVSPAIVQRVSCDR